MKWVRDNSGRFRERPHYHPDELEQLCEDTMTRFLWDRHGRVAFPASALLLAVSTDPWNPESTVYRLVLYAWSGLSGCFTAPVLMALFYSRMTRSGCLAGIICGGATSLLWHHFPPLGFAAYELIPAVVVSALSIWWVSRLSGNSSYRQQV